MPFVLHHFLLAHSSYNIYLAIGYGVFSWFLQSARVSGTLLRLGE